MTSICWNKGREADLRKEKKRDRALDCLASSSLKLQRRRNHARILNLLTLRIFYTRSIFFSHSSSLFPRNNSTQNHHSLQLIFNFFGAR